MTDAWDLLDDIKNEKLYCDTKEMAQDRGTWKIFHENLSSRINNNDDDDDISKK